MPEGIPQAFNASRTRAGVAGMCSSRLAGEAMKSLAIASSLLGPGILRRLRPTCKPPGRFVRRNKMRYLLAVAVGYALQSYAPEANSLGDVLQYYRAPKQ